MLFLPVNVLITDDTIDRISRGWFIDGAAGADSLYVGSISVPAQLAQWITLNLGNISRIN